MSIHNHCVEHNYTGSICSECLLKDAVCVICQQKAFKVFFRKALCDHHYEVSAH